MRYPTRVYQIADRCRRLAFEQGLSLTQVMAGEMSLYDRHLPWLSMGWRCFVKSFRGISSLRCGIPRSLDDRKPLIYGEKPTWAGRLDSLVHIRRLVEDGRGEEVL